MKFVGRDVRFLQTQEQIFNEPGSKEEALLYFYFIEHSLSSHRFLGCFFFFFLDAFPESM